MKTQAGEMRSNIKKPEKKKKRMMQVDGTSTVEAREKPKSELQEGWDWLERLLASNMILCLFPTPQAQKYPCTRYNIYCFAHDGRTLCTQGRRYRR